MHENSKGEEMLRVKVYINEEELEDMQIVNTGEKMENGDTIYDYRCGDIDYKIYHNRTDGWEVLLYKVMRLRVEILNQLLAMNLRELIKL